MDESDPQRVWGQADWPAAELETLGHCPVCGEAARAVWRSELSDLIFKAAPGRWTLWRCARCEAAYLDPRPDARSIGRAYSSYYTHVREPARHFIGPGDEPRQGLKRALYASYYRWRFGHRLTPRLPGGWIAIAASACRRPRAEQTIRHLPVAPRRDSVLLDVGCGDGGFLRVARALGYTAEGVEADDAPARVARQGGFLVHTGAIDDMPLAAGRIDQITLNHVIEHLHDPVTSLRRLLAALRPGGRIWLQTPNIDGLGAAQFGSAWRGLEPPRHLVMFNAPSLRRALQAAGYVDVQRLPPPPDASFYVAQSQALRDGRDPYAPLQQAEHRAAQRLGEAWNRAARREPARAESVTMVAFKPSAH
jgi:2-polyprenyl-3-methyl-5-hydroxy-6-metoxy-1,4-benzoquinol methylase